MTYELAKELKEAGFPIPEELPSYDGEGLFFTKEESLERYSPNLEELIEACDYNFFGLRRTAPERGSTQHRWLADGGSGTYEKGSLEPVSSYGSTPTEAVAHLWLALNKDEYGPITTIDPPGV